MLLEQNDLGIGDPNDLGIGDPNDLEIDNPKDNQTDNSKYASLWSKFPCVLDLALKNNVNMDTSKDAYGSYKIGNFRYWYNGRKGDVNTQVISNYSCNDPEFKNTSVNPGNTVKTKKFNITDITGQDITNGKVVQRYMSGNIVGQIQNLLIIASKNLNNPELANISKNGTSDNYFGNRTESAVKLYQKLKGLNNDGKVGPKTWYFLSKELSNNSTPNSNTSTNDNTPTQGSRRTDNQGNTEVYDSNTKQWISDSDYLSKYNTDGTLKNTQTTPSNQSTYNGSIMKYDDNGNLKNYDQKTGEEVDKDGNPIPNVSYQDRNLKESVQIIKIKDLIKKIK